MSSKLAMPFLFAADFGGIWWGNGRFRLYFAHPKKQHSQWIGKGTPMIILETREELEWFLNGHPNHSELGLWATIHKPTNQFIGRCGLLLWTIEGREEVEAL